ncbi:MAG TPA: flippase-like domain-containing protein [Candidatus Binatia bacterium]|nr:flippase-like domain-containing protein [Candidatus Binatia bacterium]
MTLPTGAEQIDVPRGPEEAPGTRLRVPFARTAIALVAGLALLGFLIYHADVDAIHDRMDELRWYGPLVLVPWVVIACLDARGWRCTLPPDAARRVPFHSLVLVRMAGEAVNSLTPTAAVGGEPVKAHLLRAWGVSGSDSLASIVIAKTALTVTQSLFVVVGIAALLYRMGEQALALAWGLLLLLVTAGFAIALVRIQRGSPASVVWRWLHRLAPRAKFIARLEETVAAIDLRLADFYRREGDAFWRAGLWHFAGWLFGVTEVALIMSLIGAPVTWLDALIIEALSQPIRAAAIVVPGGLGTQEVGGVALCTFLGMAESDAATLWLLKRGRELAFDGLGLLYLTRRSARRRRQG